MEKINEIEKAKANFEKYQKRIKVCDYLSKAINEYALKFYPIDLMLLDSLIEKRIEMLDKLNEIEIRILTLNNSKCYDIIKGLYNWEILNLPRRTAYRRINEYAQRFNKIMEDL